MPVLTAVGDGADRSARPDDALLARVVTDDSALALIVRPDLEILYANESCRRYGWLPEQIVGRNAMDWIHPDDLPRAAAAAGAVHTQAGFGTSPFRFRLPDGDYVSLDVASVVIKQDDGSELLAFSLRPNPFDRARDEAFRAMVAGAPPEESLSGLAAAFSPSRPAGLIAFDARGRRMTVGALPPELGGVFDGRQDRTPGAPWTEALDTMSTVTITSTEGLPEAVRQAADELGVTGAAFMGTPDPGRPQGALLAAWSDEPAIMGLLEVNLGDIESLVRLALDRRASHERLEHLAHHDPLTGLANRASFFAQLGIAGQADAPLAVAYLDLDGFKGANDRHGHAAGDAVLVELGRRFAREVRAGDAVARLGGDEFGVMLSDPQDQAAAVAVIERLLAAARQPIDLSDGTSVTLAASAGLVVVDDPRGATPDALVHRADTALYRAKRTAKGTLALAGPDDATGRSHDDTAAAAGSPVEHQ